MKTTISRVPAQGYAILLLALVTPALAAAADTPVRVTITHVAKPGGVLLLGAYDAEAGWLGPSPAFGTQRVVPAELGDGPVELELELALPPGRWALSVFQDMNGNRKLDANFLGIPSEPSGSSNDPPARWSAPKFADALVTVGDAPLALSIRLN